MSMNNLTRVRGRLRNRKGQIPVHLFIEIISVIIVALVLLLGFKIFGTVKEKTREATSLKTEEQLKTMIETIALRVGSSQRAVLNVPEDVKMACFIDRSADLSSLGLVSEFPVIATLLEDPDTNLFLIAEDNTVEALSVGPVCVPPYPYYLCINTTSSQLDAMLEGRGNCTVIRDTMLGAGQNIKNLDKYPSGVVFVVDEENVEDVYRLIPVSHWIEGTNVISYPLLAMHVETATQQEYLAPLEHIEGFETAVFFGSLPQQLSQGPKVVQEPMEMYFGYWLDYDDIVVVSDEHLDSGIIAGLYASSLNAPLIFVNADTAAVFRDKVQARKVHVIGPMPSAILADLERNARELVSLSFNQASDPSVTPFSEISSTPVIATP